MSVHSLSDLDISASAEDLQCTNNFEKAPDVSIYDIFNYLILQKSYYDRKKVKAYKSFDDYRLFWDGNVRSIECAHPGNVTFFQCQVRHTNLQGYNIYTKKSTYQAYLAVSGDRRRNPGGILSMPRRC